ncbi:MAG: hypothetical protein IPL46_24925 [Saprospiraceae bacterium]|nr:hypothetical protein [Saprospiraceae bacterium]
MFEWIIEVDTHIDIINFHYAWPESVTANYGYNRPINYDESGFAGRADSTYLRQAWSFMLNGGAIFNNLDYSFYVGKEDGTGPNNAPGGGSVSLRKQLHFLRQFLERFDYINMKPSSYLMAHAPGLEYYCLANLGKEYALYYDGRNQGFAWLELPNGSYTVEVYDPDKGILVETYKIDAVGRETRLRLPRLVRTAVSIVNDSLAKSKH